MSDDPFAQFKAVQRQSWIHFSRFEVVTTLPAARLVKFAQVRAGQHLLDVGCGTGVVALTARRVGATVCGLDLTPELLQRARENAAIAGLEVEWREGDAEALPYGDGTFDVVLSQFGHMFAPRPDVAVREMLRVLKPGGTVAFSTWPPELFTGRMFALVGRYASPPPPGVAPPPQWGDCNVVRERLGAAVRDIVFDRGTMLNPALSPQHFRAAAERAVGPVIKLVQQLGESDPGRLATFRREYDDLTATYFEDNVVRQDYLMTRAMKV
jgi:SAM-dependent methyltransferase